MLMPAMHKLPLPCYLLFIIPENYQKREFYLVALYF